MAEKEYHKCNKEQGFCPTLSDRVKFSGDSGYGLFRFQCLNVFSGQVETLGVNYKSNQKDRGVMLNYCPYCGEKIDWFRDELEEKEELTTAST